MLFCYNRFRTEYKSKIMAAFHNRVFSLALMVTITISVSAAPVIFQSRDKQIVLLELFTSEGCSSCPPAEKWLSGLKESSRLWRDFVPVAFHVDYWDYLGWRDPWASKSFSDRQRAYADFWRSDSIYTPGFVLNGKEWRVWSRPKDGPQASGMTVGVLKVSSEDQKDFQVSFAPANSGKADFEVHAALLANGQISDVKAGENRGRRLGHDFVVIALAERSLKAHGDKAEGRVNLKATQEPQSGRLALAVWVTLDGHLAPLQAVGGWLP
jgi:hypothetical protein